MSRPGRRPNEASQQRIKVLEQLMGVYRDLEGVPATLESAYQELKNPPDAQAKRSPSEEHVSAGRARDILGAV